MKFCVYSESGRWFDPASGRWLDTSTVLGNPRLKVEHERVFKRQQDAINVAQNDGDLSIRTRR